MTGKTVQRQSVSRRTLLAGTAGLLGGAALARSAALAQTNAPPSTGGGVNSPSNPRYFPNETWLAQRQEEIIEPGLEIVDPHHHLWDRDGHRFLIDELLAYTGSGHNITQTVFIECGSMYRAEGPVEMKPVGETEFVNGTAAMSASGRYGPTRLCAGIVGHADLRLGDAVAVLEAQITAGDGRFRGIRHSVTWDASDTLAKARTDPPKGQMLDATWRAGFARLAPLNLTFEAWLYHPQLFDLADLARAFPQTTIILNHVGGPIGIGPYKGKEAETFALWKAGISELGKYKNVVVKLGGLGMLMGMFDFNAREKPPSSTDLATAYKPYIETCIAAFGVDRAMFQSNFPPDGASSSYPIVWNAFKRLAAGHSASEKAALFSGTAKRVYRHGLVVPNPHEPWNPGSLPFTV